jgi:tRNA (Thr-GGU) A37 N-methylase
MRIVGLKGAALAMKGLDATDGSPVIDLNVRRPRGGEGVG